MASATSTFNSRWQRGVSMIEVMLVLVVTGLAVGASMPSVEGLRQRAELTGVAAQIETDVHFARSAGGGAQPHTAIDTEGVPWRNLLPGPQRAGAELRLRAAATRCLRGRRRNPPCRGVSGFQPDPGARKHQKHDLRPSEGHGDPHGHAPRRGARWPRAASGRQPAGPGAHVHATGVDAGPGVLLRPAPADGRSARTDERCPLTDGFRPAVDIIVKCVTNRSQHRRSLVSP